MLDVIVSKTLEQAQMEVEEEEELRVIRRERKNYDIMHAAEEQRIMALEAQQRQKFRAKEDRVARERERVAKEHMVYHKVGSVQFVKVVLDELRGRVYDDLETTGFFPDMLEEEVKHDFMPWLYEKAAQLSEKRFVAMQTADALINSALQLGRRKHRERKCYIRVVVNVGDITHIVGPIVVANGDTVKIIHDRITQWLENRGTAVESLGGPIKLSYGSPPVPLADDEILLSIRGLDLNQLHVSVELPPVPAGEDEPDN